MNSTVRRLYQSGIEFPWHPNAAEGPHFVYDTSPGLFFQRRGRGPLHVAWDTNLLIDYSKHGLRLWEGASLPEEDPGPIGEELEGLQMIMTLWVLRDIRFHVPRFFLKDTKKKPLTEQRRRERRVAMRQFAEAITLVADGEGSDAPMPRGPHAAEKQVLARVSKGNDRILVQEALRSGMDVS